jgi:hypothetical protein
MVRWRPVVELKVIIIQFFSLDLKLQKFLEQSSIPVRHTTTTTTTTKPLILNPSESIKS